ncbi:UDP-glucose 4-epimerase [Dactylosporangium vinaceum]|uniref:UDP-glucose 4-epimerase n=1 Tax=Dactylosporangium vinaceum TaxID=53362 RepID=A0ABV5MH15_9ACTN|nr:NAD-dependent epimerase/dehydratase family protein [Dactylosporangium vinaceum]UAB94895.1 UDP-glucose 4-epimerase [Dactylosporangium vinaceum]
MRVLVTGGLGYLGHAVTLELQAAGHDVTVMTRGRTDAKPPAAAELVVGDIRDRARVAAIVRTGNFDGVCHLAAVTQGRESFADPLTYWDVNTGGTLNLLLALDRFKHERQPARFVFASSHVVYGAGHEGTLAENLPLQPNSPYGASKAAAEDIVNAYAATGGINAVVLRVFNLAGAAGEVGDTDTARIIPNVFRAISGQANHVMLNGDGSAVRDFVHVMDAAAAFRAAIESPSAGNAHIFNVASGHGNSVAEIIATSEQVTGRHVPIIRNPSKPEAQSLVADIELITSKLGWLPRRSNLTTMISDAWAVWL